MRRKDRETTREAALALADRCQYAVLATVNGDGSPYCVPICAVRDEWHIYFHCAKEGQKITNIKANPKVCLTYVGGAAVIEKEFTVAYESAVVCGVAEEVTADQEKIRALRILCQKLAPGGMDGFDSAMSDIEAYEYEAGAELVGWLRERADELDFAAIAKKLEKTEQI
jgi:nitroimidazol reductase NimA-like FMN-containing flavoprotein (pyridoxamine 5'-phosphate oxidase superfamily)